jgi:hypothetical protein
VLKVLQKLPQGLAISVLAASKADLEKQLSILSESLHPLAVEATFPSIRSHHSLTLDLASLGNLTTACAVLHAATTAKNALQKLHLKHIPVCDNDHLLQLISAACRSALDVCLHFTHSNQRQVPQSQPFVQLEATLSHNTALTSLQLSPPDVPYDFFKFECLLESLKSLQTLKLAPKGDSPNWLPPTFPLPPARHFINMPFLTHLCLGHGFHVKELSQIVPYLTRLQALSLRGFHIEELPQLSPLTALQTLELDHCLGLEQVPPLDSLTALQTLQFTGLWHLLQIPPLATLTALQTLQLAHCEKLQTLPPLHTLTALQALLLANCLFLKELPPLTTLTALQTLDVRSCERLLQLPPLPSQQTLKVIGWEEVLRMQALERSI